MSAAAEGSAGWRRLAPADFTRVKPVDPEQQAALAPIAEELRALLLEKLQAFGCGAALLVVDEIASAATDMVASDSYWLAEPLCSARAGFDIMVKLDRSLVFALCEGAFGGAGVLKPFAEERPFSDIEKRIGALFSLGVGTALQEFLGASGLPHPSFTRPVQAKPSAKPAKQAGNFAISLSFICDAYGYNGELVIALQAAMVDALAGLTGAEAEPIAPDPAPQRAIGLSSGLAQAMIDLSVVLGEFGSDLHTLAALRIGQCIPIAARLDTPVAIHSAEGLLCEARLVKTESHFAVSILGSPPRPPLPELSR